jgi:hypothetical protein
MILNNPNSQKSSPKSKKGNDTSTKEKPLEWMNVEIKTKEFDISNDD